MGGAFGGSSQTVFGGSGAGNVLTRATTASAALFMILSAVLAWMSSSRDSNLEDVLREVEESNRSALLEAAEDSATDDVAGDDGAGDDGASDDGATGAAPSEAPTEAAEEGGTPSDIAPVGEPGAPSTDLPPDEAELPSPEGGAEPVEPSVPTLGEPAPE